MTRVGLPLLLSVLATAPARADAAPDPVQPDPAAPAPPPASPAPSKPREPPGTHLVELVGFGAELGGSPSLFAAKLGVGSMRGGDRPTGRWMAWLEADGTDWFRPAQPANAARVDRVLWIYPHLEASSRLLRRSELFGWVRAGPTLGRYLAGSVREALLFTGVAAGAGLEWSPLRLGVTWYGQWTSATVRPADAFASPAVRMAPMIFVTAGLELTAPIPR